MIRKAFNQQNFSHSYKETLIIENIM